MRMKKKIAGTAYKSEINDWDLDWDISANDEIDEIRCCPILGVNVRIHTLKTRGKS